MDHAILDLVKRSAALPSMPQAATRFLEIIQDPEFDVREVVEVLSSDPGTASEILRLANSPLFGVTRQVTSLQQALTLLGLKRIRSLVLGRYIVDSINQKAGSGLDTSYYWRRSLATAVLSARLADQVNPKWREEAFISGLLADIGIMILADTIPEQYQPIAAQYRPHGKFDLHTLERTLLDATHAQVSAMVLEHWQLPAMVCEAVRLHTWEEPAYADSDLAKVVGSADRISKFLCEQPQSLDDVVAQCRKVMEVLKLEPATLAHILDELEGQISEFAELLHIDLISSQLYALMAQAIRDRLAVESASIA